MKSMKKCIAVLLAILMLVCSFSVVSVSAETYTENGVTYTLDKNSKTAYVKEYQNTVTADEVVIPATVDECSVVGVALSAFRFNTNVVSVTLPETIKVIEGYAFDGCSNLEKVEMNAEVERISAAAFRDCKKLTSIYLGNSLLSLGGSAFKASGIKEITIPDTCEIIESSAFYGCEQLESVKLPSSLKIISASLFEKCSKLKEASIPENVVKIDSHAFNSCSMLEKVEMGDKVESIGMSAFQDCVSLKDINLSESLTELAIYAFWDCDSLERIDVPSGVTVLNFQVLRGCDKLHTINLHEGLTTIGGRAMMTCASLRNIAIPSTVTEISSLAFAQCKDIVIYGERDSAAHKFAKEQKFGFIGYEYDEKGNAVITAFECPSVVDVVIPETLCSATVKSITKDAFKGNTKIKSVTFNSEIDMIPEYAFDGCTSLENVQFSAEDTHIGKYAFANCTSIKNICLPEGVATIDEGAFGYVTVDGEYVPSEEFHIYSSVNSAAQKYCEENNIQFRFGLLKEIETGKIVSAMNYVEKQYEAGDKYRMINVLGDVNSDLIVNVKDATEIQKYCADLVTIEESVKHLADTNFDGNVNVKDATHIQKYAASIIVSFYK
ncbi:MAG: leucine-rich repeat protein [Ruminococcus sp.]|nr:leucine-rich repeat protein [Ruminococcus sp.]